LFPRRGILTTRLPTQFLNPIGLFPSDLASLRPGAYGKLRNEVGNLEKKLAASDRECKALRQDLASAQSLLHTLEATKTDFTIDLAAARAQIADLESNLAQRTGEGLALREENRRLDERLVTVDKRVIAIEGDHQTARTLMVEDEKRAQ